MKTFINYVMFAATASAGCAISTDDQSDLMLEGRVDIDPEQKQPLRFYDGRLEARVDAKFDTLFGDEHVYAPLIYSELEVFGPAIVTLETKLHTTAVDAWNEINRDVDTVMYLYKPRDTYGRYLARNDNGGWRKYSKLEGLELDKGIYHVVLKLKPGSNTDDYNPIVDLVATCSGACVEPPDQPPVCSPNDLDCMIGNAVIPLEGANPSLTAEVSFESLPAAVRPAAQNAIDEIEGLSFPAYEAGVVGIYAVYRSESDHTIVAYVVYGAGSGEPDYHDGMVIGINPAGTRIYYARESG